MKKNNSEQNLATTKKTACGCVFPRILERAPFDDYGHETHSTTSFLLPFYWEFMFVYPVFALKNIFVFLTAILDDGCVVNVHELTVKYCRYRHMYNWSASHIQLLLSKVNGMLF